MAASEPFRFDSSATLTRFTGVSADNLHALLRGIQRASGASIYYHVFHALFRRHFTTSEYMNDFAHWAWYTLHERQVAEKLAAVDPTAYVTPHEARQALARVLEDQLGHTEFVPRVRDDLRFHFIDAQTFIFSTGIEARDPRDFADKIRQVPPGAIFYHFVMAPMRLGRRENDFSAWLHGQGAEELAKRIDELSPYSGDLYTLRDRLSELCRT